MNKLQYFSLVLEAKRPDGQYGIQSFCVQAYDLEDAKARAILEAKEEGVTEVKFLFQLRP